MAAPPVGSEWRLCFATNEAAKGWGELCGAARGNARRCDEALRADPLSTSQPDRQHRLRGRLGSAVLRGRERPQWESEVTAGGRVRYLVDVESRTGHFVDASPRHPRDTDA